jgi:hypothetical protein
MNTTMARTSSNAATITKIPTPVVPEEEVTIPHFNNASARKKWFNRNFPIQA